MGELMLKLYDKKHGADGTREGLGAFAGTVGLLANIFLSVIKLFAGILSRSVSVIAEAVNNLSDAGASVVTLLGFRLARKPADREHPYGHARLEYMSGAVIGIAILLVGVELLKGSVNKILNPTAAEFSAVTFIVLAIAIAVKLWMRAFYRRAAKRIDSSSLMAAADDSRNDILTSTAVLLSAAVEYIWHLRVDGWVGAGVAVFILISGVGILRDASSPLLGEAPSAELRDRISAIILSHEGVLGYHDLLIHSYGPSTRFATVHVEMSATDDPLHSHGVLDNMERDVKEELNVNLVIHLDPVAQDDDELAAAKKKLAGIVQSVDPALSFHDLRMVKTHDHTNLVFDLALPSGYKNDIATIEEFITQGVRATFGDNYYIAVDLDRNYGASE